MQLLEGQTLKYAIAGKPMDVDTLLRLGDAEAAVRCAVELSRALRSEPSVVLRMGIHTGPVYRVSDINANRNVAGAESTWHSG